MLGVIFEMQSFWRALVRCVVVWGGILVLGAFAAGGVAAQTDPAPTRAPTIPFGSSIRVTEPGDAGWASVVLELPVTLEEEDEDDPSQPRPDFCFPYQPNLARGTASAADVRFVPGDGTRASGEFLVVGDNQDFAASDDLQLAGDDLLEGDETFYLDVYAAQQASTCSVVGAVIARVEVVVEDDDQDASGVSPAEFTVVETDEDAPAALALTFAQAADAGRALPAARTRGSVRRRLRVGRSCSLRG